MNADSEGDEESGPDQAGLIDPGRMLRIMSTVALVGGVFTLLGIALPHPNTTYDREYLLVGVAMLVLGACWRWRSSRPSVTTVTVHLANLTFTFAILALAWLGMVDVGGVQAVFLFIPLGVTASLGPLAWTLGLLGVQAAGYGVVLATSDPILGFDHVTQWTAVVMGLVVAVIFQDLLRRHLVAAKLRDEEVRAERDAQRRAHSERLAIVNLQLAEANELKNRFVAIASHELRTPLSAISGFAITMVDRWESISDEDKRSYVGIIEEQSARLSRLVADLLTLSRIEEGRVEAAVDPVSIAEAADRTLRRLGMDDVDVDCAREHVAFVSEDHLEQILVNLLGNAVSHGEPPVKIATNTAGDGVVLSVADSGSGVNSEFVPELFSRFTRGPGSELTPGGAGLGLSIVAGLARAHGGDVWYEPNEPTGSRFCVRLPAEAPAAR